MFEALAPWLLTIIIFLPAAGALVLFATPADRLSLIRRIAVTTTLATFVFALGAMMVFFRATTPDATDLASKAGGYALVKDVLWIGGDGVLEHVAIRYKVGLDAISLWLMLLAAMLTPLVVWSSATAIRDNAREYYALLLLLETGMLGVFCSLDLVLFFVFFEFTLIPLYFLIGRWGSGDRMRAANKFFIYTMAGSVLTFAGVLAIGYQAYAATGTAAFDFDTLFKLADDGRITPEIQKWIFIAFAAGFAVKVPLFPLHTWLPLAHTEAPTAGSVILAGVLLKLGTYGFLRFCIPMLPDAALTFAPFAGGIAVAGIVYGALVAWVQTDIKRLVAYSSVSHLGFCILGMFSLTMIGLSGSVIYMINHGLSTGALFLLVGMIYERYHTREFNRLSGLARRMPWMAFFLVFFTLSSIGLPGLNGFIGEFTVLLGTALSRDHTGHLGLWYAVPAALGIVLGAIYMLYFVRRVCFGPLVEPEHTPDTSRGLTNDLTLREIGILTPLALLCIWIGLYPAHIFDSIQPALQTQVINRVLVEPGVNRNGAMQFRAADASQEEESDTDASPAQSDNSIRLVSTNDVRTPGPKTHAFRRGKTDANARRVNP